jgi:hypothetical protein
VLTRRYKTNLHCGSCVATLRPVMDGAVGPGAWEVETDSPDKVLSVAEERAGPEKVRELVRQAGFQVLGELPSPSSATATAAEEVAEASPATYYPLALLLAFLLGGVALLQLRAPARSGMQAMSDFMGLFFVAFAFFKLLDVPAFAASYAGYDVIARRWYGWGYVYPFVELALGVLYLGGWLPLLTNALTLAVTLVGSVGVLQALLARRKIRCACLGAVFNLPMSTVSLAEDVVMAVMAAGMLVTLLV